MLRQNSGNLKLTKKVIATVVPTLGLFGLALIAYKLYGFAQDPARVLAGNFGTAHAPYSDPLGPWLAGALHAIFGLPQIDFLYRPTVGLFWGSVIAMTGRIEFIPLLFLVLWFAACLALLMFWRNSNLGIALAAWLSLLAFTFHTSIEPLLPLTLGLDFPAFTLTAFGTLLILASTRERTPDWLSCLTGSFLLGIAAAIRGPMMTGGAVLIICLLVPLGRVGIKAISLSMICFLIPIAADAFLQKHYHVINNGIVALFCVYSDPSHTWTGECHSRYIELGLGTTAIARSYIDFLISSPGITFLARGVNSGLGRDFALFLTSPFAVLLALVTAWKIWMFMQYRSSKKHGDQSSMMQKYGVHLWFLFLLWGFFIAGRQASSWIGVFGSVLLSICILSSMKLRLWLPLALLLAYLAAFSFLLLSGLGQVARLGLTFSFLLHFGVLLLLVQPDDPAYGPLSSGRRTLTLPVLVVLSALYTCWAWWPSAIRSTYLARVEGRTAAIKIADDKQIDRSLYFTGQHVLLYTHSDDLAVGSARNYKTLRYPNRIWNESFIEPNTFVD